MFLTSIGASLLLFISLEISISNALQFNESVEKASFKKYFIKAYKLRFNDTNIDGRKNDTRLSRRSLKGTSDKLLEDAYNRYKVSSELEKSQKVSRNGTTDEQLDMMAEEIWDRTGGKLVEATLVRSGALIGSQVGGYVGGTLGMAVGFLIPPLQVPIIIGGVFIGRNLGRVLETISSKIASDFVNNLIADSVIGKYMVTPLYTMLVGNISKDATQTN